MDTSTDRQRLVIDPSLPEVFSQIFPSRGAGLALAKCIEIVRKFRPDFQVPEGGSAGKVFRSNLWSPLVTERTIDGLQVFGMVPADLSVSPYLPILNFQEVAKVGKISHVTEGTVKISRMKEYLANGSMRGSHVQNKIKITEASLTALGFESFCGQMQQTLMKKFSRSKSIR